MILNRNFDKKYILVLLIAFVFQSVFATDYYCDPVNGNKKNKGTKESPWGKLADIFKEGRSFEPGDKIFLMTGDHGDVIITGENTKYIRIIADEGQKPVLKSVVFGTASAKASRWEIIGVTITGAPELVNMSRNSSRIRITSCEISQEDGTAIRILGDNNRIEHNYIHHIQKAILVGSEKNQIRNNRIEYFSGNAVEITGNLNLFEYNLIKESVNTKVNTAFYIPSQPVQGNIIRGNTIINFIKNNRNDIGVLNGIYGTDVNITESIIENNVIISNGESGIDLKGTVNKSKIVNNTVVNPYFGLNFSGLDKANTPLSIKITGKGTSANLIIRNNLVNNFVLENIKGLADHNLTLPVNVHEYDQCFQNWALFDFSLGENSKALNKGTLEYAPKMDAGLNKRPLGNFINIGAFEYTKINDANETFVIDAELTDRQIHSKGKSDWDGQPQIRIGGAGEKFDAAGVFPFKLPLIPGGKEIISANFKVYLSRIDNKPEGNVDLYGLPPKTNFWVTEDMFYQGTYGQDLKARPVQKAFFGQNTYEGSVGLKAAGKAGLKDYLTTVYENVNNDETFIFLRLNPSAKDVTDFHRWSVSSANSEKEERKPKLEIVVGYPELNKPGAKQSAPVKHIIAAAASPVKSGELALYFLGFNKNESVKITLFSYRGKEVLKKDFKVSDLKDNIYRTKNLSLPAGKYIIQYTTGNDTKKQTLFIW